MDKNIVPSNLVFAATCAMVGAAPWVFLFTNPHTILALTVVLIPQFFVHDFWPLENTETVTWQVVLIYSLASTLSVALFSVPATLIMVFFRRVLEPRITSALLLSWFSFYMLMLFVLFEPERFP